MISRLSLLLLTVFAVTGTVRAHDESAEPTKLQRLQAMVPVTVADTTKQIVTTVRNHKGKATAVTGTSIGLFLARHKINAGRLALQSGISTGASAALTGAGKVWKNEKFQNLVMDTLPGVFNTLVAKAVDKIF